MQFEIFKTEDNKKYVYLTEIKLGQDLRAVYGIKEKSFLILDPDSKDYQGNEYTKKLKLNDKEYGIVQTIDENAILKLAELHKIIRVLK